MDGHGSGGRGEGRAGAGPGAQARLDAAAGGLLLAWAALALAGLASGSAAVAAAADIAAWAAFGGALLLVGLPRWLSGVSDRDIIGPLRLWVAACAAALLFCMASSFVAAPRIKDVQSQIARGGLPAERAEALLKGLARARGFSAQFLCIRMALAVGLAVGTKKLPRPDRGGGAPGPSAAPPPTRP